MNLSQFPERFRARVLSGIVRNGRRGISIRFGQLEGSTLPLLVSQAADSLPPVPPEQLEQAARATFRDMPYDLQIVVS